MFSLIVLPKASYADIRSLFLNFHYQLSVFSVINQTLKGKIWVDRRHNPKSALLLFGDGYVLVGDSSDVQFINELRDFFLEIIDLAKNPPFTYADDAIWLHTTNEWVTKFKEIFPTREPIKVHRVHYICENLKFNWEEALPKDCRIVPVDKNYKSQDLTFARVVREWVDPEWLEENIKQGFGSCMVKGNEIISWGSADCYSGEECEIGIFVEPEYRRRRIGTITAAAAADFAFRKGFKRIGWHTEMHNHESIGVAKKIGFTKERDYYTYVCIFNKEKHLAELASSIQ